MAKKRHWKKRAKLQAGLNSTENIKVTGSVGKKETISQNHSDTFKENSQNRKTATDKDCDEKLLSAKVIDGETCFDIECGSNKAVMYISKMCLGSKGFGSKGSCILFKGAWLTPNEFQFVSGRENAKDWKRSIRHNGSSLKLLFSKNLLKLSESPKKSEDSSEEKENDEQVLKMSPEVSDEEASTETQTSEPGNDLTLENEEEREIVSPLQETDAQNCVEGDEKAVTEMHDATTDGSMDKGTDAGKIQDDDSDATVDEFATETMILSSTKTTTESTAEPVTESATETMIGFSTETVTESPAEPVTKSTTESMSKSTVEDVSKSATETVTGAATGIVTESTVDPVTESASENVMDTATEIPIEATESQQDNESTESMQGIEESTSALPVEPTTKQNKRRRKKGKGKKGWARQKSRTTTPAARSRKSSVAKADELADEVVCPYETLTEEDKLAVFVKALRLLRKRDLPEAISNTSEQMPIPHHSTQVHNTEMDLTIKPHTEMEDREMPVLEKEVDIVLPNRSVDPAHPHIFPSTVTPPPTPPLTESPDLDEIKRELKNIDQSVFESRLTPVEEGIKLKINRLADGSEKVIKTESVETKSPKQEVANCNSQDVKDYSKLSDSTSKSLTDNQASTVSSAKPAKVPQCVTNESSKQTHSTEPHNTERKSSPCFPCPGKMEAAHAGFSSHSTYADDALSAAKNNHEILQMNGIFASPAYSPMLTPEQNIRLYHELLAAYSTMQHSVGRPEVSQKSRNSYIPNTKSTNHVLPSFTQQQLATKRAYEQGKSALFEGTNFHKRRNSPGVVSPVGISNIQKYENMDRKRKFSDCEGALDLSMKKPKVDTPVTSVPQTYNYIMDQESPLDFSMKKQTSSSNTYPVNAAKQPNFSLPVQRTNSIQNIQCQSNVSTYPVWKYSRQSDKHAQSRKSDTFMQNRKSDTYVQNRKSEIITQNKKPDSVQNRKSDAYMQNRRSDIAVQNKKSDIVESRKSDTGMQNKMSDIAQSRKSETDVQNKKLDTDAMRSKSSYNSMWYAVTRYLDKDMTKWTVDNVCSFLGCLDGCSEYLKMFRDQGINGRILPFLTTQHLTRTLGMSVGSALTLQYAIGRFFKDNCNPNHLGSRSRVSV